MLPSSRGINYWQLLDNIILLPAFSLVLETNPHLGVLQYLNKQTTALKEVNDSRLKIYEQVG